MKSISSIKNPILIPEVRTAVSDLSQKTGLRLSPSNMRQPPLSNVDLARFGNFFAIGGIAALTGAAIMWYVLRSHQNNIENSTFVTDHFLSNYGQVTRQGNRLIVKGNINLTGRTDLAQQLPKNLTVDGNLILNRTDIDRLPDNLRVNGNLSMNDCQNITRLQNNFTVQGDLSLRDCRSLIQLPEHLTVKKLDLSACTRLPQLPEHLTVQRDIDLTFCYQLTKLPESFTVHGGIYLTEAFNFMELPETLTQVQGNLNLGLCHKMTQLPQNLANIQGNLTCPSGITRLPDNLHVQGDLHLGGCRKLIGLPENLRVGGELKLHGCQQLNQVPRQLNLALSKVRSARSLSLYNLGLQEVPESVQYIQGLETLNLRRNNLNRLPDSLIGKLPTIKNIFIADNPISDDEVLNFRIRYPRIRLFEEDPTPVLDGVNVHEAVAVKSAEKRAQMLTNLLKDRKVEVPTPQQAKKSIEQAFQEFKKASRTSERSQEVDKALQGVHYLMVTEANKPVLDFKDKSLTCDLLLSRIWALIDSQTDQLQRQKGVDNLMQALAVSENCNQKYTSEILQYLVASYPNLFIDENITRDQIIDDFWPPDDPGRSSQELTKLKKVFVKLYQESQDKKDIALKEKLKGELLLLLKNGYPNIRNLPQARDWIMEYINGDWDTFKESAFEINPVRHATQ